MDKHAKNPTYLQIAESDLEISFCTDTQLTDKQPTETQLTDRQLTDRQLTDTQLTDTQLEEIDADPEDHEYLLLYDDWKLPDDTDVNSTHSSLSEESELAAEDLFKSKFMYIGNNQ